MSKKNSSVNLKNGFRDYKDLSKIFINFKIKLHSLNKKKYVVAVSGGPDSLGLVALTQAYAQEKKTKFYYVLIDHNIRKKSNQEAIQVKKLLKKKNITLKILLNKKKIIKNIQAEARNARYHLLVDYCKKINASVLLTAHNLEDQVETFFMRLSRGSGLKGLSSMQQIIKINNKINLCRPILDVKKKYLIKITKNVFGKYIKDPSNKNLRYLRTKVRALKKPLEKSGIKYDQIFKSIQNLSLSRLTLDEYLENTFNDLVKKKDQKILIDLMRYKRLNTEVKISLINHSIKQLKNNYYDLRSKKLLNLIHNLEKSNFTKSTLGGCIFLKKGHILSLKIEK